MKILAGKTKKELEKLKEKYRKIRLKKCEERKQKFIEEIKKGNNLWLPKNGIKLKKLKTNTWFNIEESNGKVLNTKGKKSKKQLPKFKPKKIKYDKHISVKIKAKKVILQLTNEQKILINNWINHYRLMYNEALKYIKKYIRENKGIKDIKIKFHNVRKALYDIKFKIQGLSQIASNEANTKIKIHDLDYAIKLACSNYKSALTNLYRHHTKRFRIRYWRQNKSIKVMDLEKNNFNYETIRYDVLGNVDGTCDGEKFDFNAVVKDSRICYNDKTGNYILYVPVDVTDKKVKKHKNKLISLDPGTRTFMTGITENKVVKIGDKCQDKIKKHLKKIDKIKKNDDLSKGKKSKIEKKINRRIINCIDEMHWKSIRYLTKNYKSILIGDLSSKRIVSNKGTNNLNKMTKRISLRFKFYEFRQRLAYKCEVLGNNYKCVNESFTSMTCCNCGTIDENLGSNKVYKCQSCKKIIDRDVNGARNIYLKSTYL
mgnify:CR=1 FL=1